MAKTIAVTGKGGVGKTTMSALIIRSLKEHAAGPILAMDADPDCNLARLLGVPVESTVGDLREDVLKQIRDLPAGMSKESFVEMGLHEIIVETDGLDLITMGRGEGPGCYCFINHVLRKFAEDLTPSYQWMVVDNEAGLEHLSRRTAAEIDHLIVVVTENPLSTDCARRIDEISRDFPRDVHEKHYLLNGVREERQEAVRERMAELDLTCLGAVPRDEAVEEAIFLGKSIYEIGSSPAVQAIDQVVARIGAG